MDINFSGLKAVLKKFGENGRYAEGKHWSIANGGYDLWWELYYDKTPVLQCIAGDLEIATGRLTKATEKRLVETVKGIYTHVKV